MHTYIIEREQWVARSIDEVFAFFSNAANLELLTPPWLRFCIVTSTPIDMKVGATIEYRITWRFTSLRWFTEIVAWNPPLEFVDVQSRGPYALWHHTHRFESMKGGTRIVDVVRYALPLGVLGRFAHRLVVRRDLERVFNFRTARVRELFDVQ
jgi:ligand-binding SRPBCC domain-containing protein